MDFYVLYFLFVRNEADPSPARAVRARGRARGRTRGQARVRGGRNIPHNVEDEENENLPLWREADEGNDTVPNLPNL